MVILGLAVTAGAVRAVLAGRGAVRWAGSAPWAVPRDLVEVIARLAGECDPVPRRARIALGRDLVQLRSLAPAPPLASAALRRWVAIEAPRLFRLNGVPLVTDAVLVPLDAKSSAAWAAAVEEPLVQAVLAGCAQAGLEVEALGPASAVLPSLVRPGSGRGSELLMPHDGWVEIVDLGPRGPWRSRRERGRDVPPLDVPALASLGVGYAPALAAALARPRAQPFTLWPADARAERARRARRRLVRLLAVAGIMWAAAAGIHVARLAVTASAAGRELVRLGPAVDSGVALRRDLAAARVTLDRFAAARRARSRHLALLADLTAALGDSVVLAALRVSSDGTVRLAGYAPPGARVVAAIERVAALDDARLEGPVTREARSGRAVDRFAVVARLPPEAAP